jgi:hypothetical protein
VFDTSRFTARRVVGEGPEVAERVVEVLPVAADGGGLVGHPRLEGRPGRLVERAQDLVELDGLRHVALGQPAVLRHGLRRLRARRELDVGLAQQRLLAQDRVGVGRDRRVLVLELDRHVGQAGALVGLEVLDLADRHAGDAHVGLLGQRRGLREGDVEAVALGLERHRAAEGQPEEQQQAEARQREDHHRGDAAGARGALVHALAPIIRRSIPVPGWTSGRSAAAWAR